MARIEVSYGPESLPSGIDEDSLRLWRYNETDDEWEQLSGGVDTEQNIVWGETDNFSTFGVFGTMLDMSGVLRLAGANRYLTAVEISKAGWPKGAHTVVLARGDDFADALTGVSLAYYLDSPILLTRTANLSSVTNEEIKRLGAERVILLGGTGAISDDVKDELVSQELIVERIAGNNRYHTAALIAQRLKDEGADFNTAFIAVGTNFADALAASSYAATNGQPILLVQTNRLPVDTGNALSSLGIVNTIVCGGESAVSVEIFQLLPNPQRIAGSNRYATAIALAESLLPNNTKHVYVSTGLNFPDAIAGGVLAAKRNSGVILVAGNRNEPNHVVQDFIANQGINGITIFGGDGAVSYEMENWLRDYFD